MLLEKSSKSYGCDALVSFSNSPTLSTYGARGFSGSKTRYETARLSMVGSIGTIPYEAKFIRPKTSSPFDSPRFISSDPSSRESNPVNWVISGSW